MGLFHSDRNKYKRYSNGDSYFGQMNHGVPDGDGRMLYANGDEYRGTFRDGVPNGRGFLSYCSKYSNRVLYSGDFRDGIPNGQGSLSFQNGDSFEGEFRDGVPDGYGTLKYADGGIYTGTVIASAYDREHTQIFRVIRSGEGIMLRSNGDFIDGEWFNDILQGNDVPAASDKDDVQDPPGEPAPVNQDPIRAEEPPVHGEESLPEPPPDEEPNPPAAPSEPPTEQEPIIYVYDGPDDAVEVTVPDGYTHIGESAFEKCQFSLERVRLPESIVSIGMNAFSTCIKLRSITLPSKLKEIGFDAFSHTDLTSIVIPDSVCEIQEFAFCGCRALETVHLPRGLTEIESHLFSDCKSLREIEVPEGVSVIRSNAYANCTLLKRVLLPEGLRLVEERAFDQCFDLETIEFRGSQAQWNSVCILDDNLACASPDSSLCYLSFGRQTDTEEHTYFYEGQKDIDAITVPDGVTRIEPKAFANVHMTSVTLPDSVTYIGRSAFRECTSLESIVIPPCVTAIREKTFYLCLSLKFISIPRSIRWIGRNSFPIADPDLYVRYDGTIEQWKSVLICEDNNALKLAVIHCTDGDLRM